jgi:drug/metabolite transporter (DMT)-like permease
MAEASVKEREKAVLAVCVAALLWSSGGVVIKAIDWDPFLIAGGRALFGGLFLLAVTRTRTIRFSGVQMIGAAAYALVGITFVVATKITLAANVVVLQYSAPIFASVLGIVLLREYPKRIDWLVLPVVLAGIYLLFADETAAGSPLGNALALFSGFSLAVLTVAMRKQKDASPLDSIILGSGLMVLTAIPFLFFRGGETELLSVNLLLVAFLGAFQVALPFLFYGYAVKRISAFEATIFKAVEPMTNPVWVFLYHGEHPGVTAIIGACAIFFSVLGRNLKESLRSRL